MTSPVPAPGIPFCQTAHQPRNAQLHLNLPTGARSFPFMNLRSDSNPKRLPPAICGPGATSSRTPFVSGQTNGIPITSASWSLWYSSFCLIAFKQEIVY